ncbi:MAG: hypothetical protein ACTSW1_04320 [Candidatus Hodarchaeales archaeon]
MYRQNTVLNDFINFLKARGRFREIEFIDNSVQAIPRIPDFPKLVFYIEETRTSQKYILEINGTESSVMNREIKEFFSLNNLGLHQIRLKYELVKEGSNLILQIEGIGPSFDFLNDQVLDLIESGSYSVESTQKTLIFSNEATSKPEIPKRRPQLTQTHQIEAKIHSSETKNSLKTSNTAISPHREITKVKEASITGKTDTQPTEAKREIARPKDVIDGTKTTIKEDLPVDSETKPVDEPFDDLLSEDASENLEADLFRPKPSKREYSEDITPYLKQTNSLFRKDNWEEDLPTEFEMEILEKTYMRIKHRTKPEILAKDLGISVEEAEQHLRSLISKGLLRTQVGWFIIKKSHLPFFKATFAESDKRKKKKKSARISRIGEGLTPEEIATINAIKSRPNLKAQSNLLTRPTGLKQSVLKDVLRNLVDKGILRVSYGWYILKDKNILEHKRGGSTLDSTSPKNVFRVPEGITLTPAEKKVIQALLERPQYKAQSNLLTTDVKLPKEQIKQVLRELVEKDICKVTYGWYMLKKPEIFQESNN